MDALLSLRGIAKRFGALEALSGVDLDVAAGEVHAVLGENGAGKSTLMKVVYGLVQPDRGRIAMAGKPLALRSALDARRAGIGMVHQEFALVDALSGVENLALALHPAGRRCWQAAQVRDAARRLAAEIGLQLGDLDCPVGELPVGARQRLEIVKALAGRTRLLILDEPTAVLTSDEVAQLFAVLRRLRAAGAGILFITHKLAEVMAIADRITVLRHGRVVAAVAREQTDAATLADAMVGHLPPRTAAAPSGPRGAPILELDAVSVRIDAGPPRLDAVSLDVRAGELFGIAGVDGNGQGELFEVLAGLRRPSAGHVRIGGRTVATCSPAAMLTAGVSCIPPDRLRDGVVGPMSAAENAALDLRLLRPGGAWRIDPTQLRHRAQALVDAYAIKVADLDAPVQRLSGGNVQKLIVARALAAAPQVIVAVTPTRGLDIAASQAVFAALGAARQRGAAILLISTDLDELVTRADRIAVLYRGRLTAPLEPPFPIGRLAAMLAGSESA